MYINIIKYKDYISLGLAFMVILIALMVIYSDTLDGSKSFYGANDKASAINVKKAISASEEYPYWFPWMMGGVPSVHSAQNISDYYPPNYIMKYLNYLGMPWFWNYIFHLLFAGIGMYFLCVKSRINQFVSILPAVGFAIMPYMTGMLVHGHGSQVMTLCYMPWVFYSYMKLRDNPSIGRLALFAMLLALQLLRGHIQMAYYTWMMLGIFIIIDVIYSLAVRNKNPIKWILYTISGLFLGILGSLSLYIPMLSYTPFSTRSSDEFGGAGIEYVTDYSFSLGEVLTFFIPSYYGFGGQTYWGTMPFTSFPHYMSVILLIFAIYGIIRYKWTRFKVFSLVCFIFFLVLSFGKNFIGFYSFFYDYLPFFSKFRNPAYLLIAVQFCTMAFAGMGLTMVLRDIKEQKIILPIYSGCIIFLFCIIPFFIDFSNQEQSAYNKERDSLIIQQTNQLKESFVEIYPQLSDPYIYAQNEEFINSEIDKTIQPIKEFYNVKNNLGKSLIRTDTYIMQIVVFISFSIISVAYSSLPIIQSKTQFDFFYLSGGLLVIIGILVFLDFYLVDRKITNPEEENYLLSQKSKSAYKDFYELLGLKLEDKSLIQNKQNYLKNSLSDVHKIILGNKGNFRILDLDGGSQNNGWARHHIEDVSGYHPAKLKSYRDFFESDKGLSYYMLSMLNVKYVIQNQQVQSLDSEERAFFIKNLHLDHENDKEKRFNLYLQDLKPSEASYLTSYSASSDIIEKLAWSPIEGLNISTYSFNIGEQDVIDNDIENKNPNEIIVRFKTSGPQFLALSEIYYPNGWYATLNQKPVHIYEVNDLIRGVFIDGSGDYELRMQFDPPDLKWGMWISSIVFIAIIGMSILAIIRRYVVK